MANAVECFKELASGVFALKTPFCGAWSGVFLIDRGGRRLLIDSGSDAEAVDRCIVPALAARGLRPASLDLLLCTHSHGDHIGGHFRLRELAPNLKIAAFEGSRDKLRDPLKYSKLIRARFPEFSPPPPPVLRGVEPDLPLGDGAEIDAGRSVLRLVHAPGHDDDCVCFHDSATGSLLAGDSLQGDGTALQGIGFYKDLPAYRASLRKLLTLNARNVIMGHSYVPFGAFVKGEASSKELLEACLAMTYQYDMILEEELAGGVKGLESLTKRLIERRGGMPLGKLFLAMHTAAEHLELKFGKDWDDRIS